MKYYTWENKLKEHYASKMLQAGPEDVDAMLSMLDEAMPVKKKSRRIFFILLSLCLGMTTVIFLFDYSKPLFLKSSVSAESEILSSGQPSSSFNLTTECFDSLAQGESKIKEGNGAKQMTRQRDLQNGIHRSGKKRASRVLPSALTERGPKSGAGTHNDQNVQDQKAQNFGVKENPKANVEPRSSEDFLNTQSSLETEALSMGNQQIKLPETSKAGNTGALENEDTNGASDDLSTQFSEIIEKNGINGLNELQEKQIILKNDASEKNEMVWPASTIDSFEKASVDVQFAVTEQAEAELSRAAIDSFLLDNGGDSAVMNDSVSKVDSVVNSDSSILQKEDARPISMTPPKNVRWELGAFGAHLITRRELAFNNTGEGDYFRLEHEKPLFARSVGLGFEGVFKNRYLFGAGYQLLSLVDETDYPDVETFSYTPRTIFHLEPFKKIDSIDSFYVQLDGEKKLVIDTQFITGFDTSFSQTFDTTQTLYQFSQKHVRTLYHQIPLTLGYRFYYKRWSFDVISGVQFNILGRTKGNYHFLNEGIPGELSSSQLSKFTIGGVLMFEVGFKVRKHWELQSSFSYSSMPSIWLNTLGVRQRYTLVGTRFGVAYSF